MTDLPFDLNYYGENIVDLIDAPVATAATALEDDRLTAHWEEVLEAVSYQLDVSDDPAFGELVTAGVPVGVDAGTLQAIVTGLAPETAYYYRVRAVKETGTVSANSNTITAETLPLFTAQGGDLVTYDGQYSRHYFDNDADFEVLTGLRRVRRLLVGGGAQGGGVNGSGVSCGGGGGGEVADLAEADRDPMAVGVYPVTVGAAGDTPGALNVGENGGDSTFDGDTAHGGGHGGSAGSSVGDGGSGGGATNSSGGPEFGGVSTAVDGVGNDGGDANAGNGGGAGGGGAEEPGGNGTALTGGKGGDGLESDITGETVRYGAGGGGARPVDPFGVIVGTTAGAGGLGGGGNGASATPAVGGDATGVGAGGGGALGNNRGGVGTKGKVVLKYKGRAADITPPPPDPAVYRGPITFAGCTRDQTVDAVEILIDCNARIDSGIYPDYQRYLCLGAGVVSSSRSYRAAHLPSTLPDDALGEHDVTNGTLVFRFSAPIRAFKITRKVTSGTDAVPFLIACDDYTVIPHPTSAVSGSSKDGAVVNLVKVSPQVVHYPTTHLDPAVDLALEEEMEITHDDGFSCVIISQQTKWPSEFVDPMFILLSD